MSHRDLLIAFVVLGPAALLVACMLMSFAMTDTILLAVKVLTLTVAGIGVLIVMSWFIPRGPFL